MYAASFTSYGQAYRFRLKTPRVRLALVQVLLTCVFHLKALVIVSVWDPSGVDLQDELEKVQNRAARIVTGNYNFETGSMTGILEHLKWESFKKKKEERQ